MILNPLERRSSRRAAFTLMEVLVVVAILVILAGTASIAIFRYLDQAKQDRARMDIQTLTTAVKTYAIKNQGQYPEQLADALQYIEGGGQEHLTDPWGNAYQLSMQEVNGQQIAVISTTAPDGVVISNINR